MNLSPRWCDTLIAEGWDTVHWSSIGDFGADDTTILEWARTNERIVLTHDLDFGAVLAATATNAPSVIQIRVHDVLPARLGPRMIAILHAYEAELTSGALIIVDEGKQRVRILPLRRN